MWRVILGLDNLSTLGKYCIHIADVANDFARLPGSCFERFAEWRGVVLRVRTAIPFDLQALTSLECGKGVVGNHGDAAQRLELVRRFEIGDGQPFFNPLPPARAPFTLPPALLP